MKDKITNLIKSCRFRSFSQLVYSYLYQKSYKANAKRNGVILKKLPDADFKNKWSKLGRIYESVTYLYYANYTDSLDDIVPESIGRTSIEYVLNPIKYRPYYADKNMFAAICGKENVPKTIVCRVNGSGLLDGDLKPIGKFSNEILASYDKVILKPTIEAKGGRGIMLFERDGEDLKSGEIVLDKNFLLNYGRDFAVQELVTQHDVLASLNETSVNTIRVAVYRSVIDDKAHVIGSFIRVGGSGMFVDNACAGGKFAGVDIESGKIASSLRDIRGGTYSSQNGIDYTKLDLIIPGWDIIKNKCLEVAENIPHHRLIAFDMTITNEMKPILIEFNVESYNYGPFMYINQPPLGEFTNEIIEYCKEELKK